MKHFPLIALIALSLLGCSNQPSIENKKKVPLVQVQPVRRASIARTLSTTGEVVAVVTVNIVPTVEGTVVFQPWREGDRIKRNEKLVGIERAAYHAEVEAAKATLAIARAKLADLRADARPEEVAKSRAAIADLEAAARFNKSDLERTSKLVSSGSLPGEAFDKAQTVYLSSQAKLAAGREQLRLLENGPTKTAIAVQRALVDEAASRLSLTKVKLSECVIQAPFAGTITKVFVRPGDQASSKSPLLEISDPSSSVIRFHVPEAQSTSVHPGQPLKVQFDAYPGQKFSARIDRVYPELERRTRTRTVEAKLEKKEEKSSLSLVPGMFARLKLALQTVPDAIVVPSDAIVVTPKGATVVYTVRGNKAFQLKVVPGIEEDGKTQLLQGVKPGDLVVVAGNEKLKDGAPVRLPKKQGGAE
ncbi:MAG TPA: hypothetical protein DD435_00215 [Cyanobacteria bacterium UBA8530]|nr:hypothetical protein [Cyanobacteria bacterium UBA8530]